MKLMRALSRRLFRRPPPIPPIPPGLSRDEANRRYLRSAIDAAVQGERESMRRFLEREGADLGLLVKIDLWIAGRGRFGFDEFRRDRLA